MEGFDKKRILYITSGQGYVFDGPAAEGYNTMHPYKPADALMLRLLREICFRIPLLPKTVWFNKCIFQYNPDYIIITDSLTTRKYLIWLKKNFPKSQINFVYSNLIGKARHIMPWMIPSGVRIWTFDENDGEKYKIRVYKNSPYPQCYVKPHGETLYDIFYIGADKGRGDYIMSLEKKLKELGLKTKFIITSDGKYSRRKPYYQERISYDQLTTYLSQSRAVLNVALDGQYGITMRDKDALFFNIKLITTNIHIKEKDLYTENNVLILSDNNYKTIPCFLKRPIDNLDSIKEKYTYNRFIEEVVS